MAGEVEPEVAEDDNGSEESEEIDYSNMIQRPEAPFGIHRIYCNCGKHECNSRGGWSYIRIGDNDRIEVKLNTYYQKDRIFAHGHLPSILIDCFSSVPAIDDTKSYSELSEDFLSKYYDKWQRPLSLKRTEKQVGEWWANKDSYIANGIVLGMEPQMSPEQQEDDIINFVNSEFGNGTLTYESWFSEKCPQHGDIGNILRDQLDNDEAERLVEILGDRPAFADFCPIPDCQFHHTPFPKTGLRPFHIIDGQHRTRGSQSGKSRNLEKQLRGHCRNGEKTHHSNPHDCLRECKLDGDGKPYWVPIRPPTHEQIPFTLIFDDTLYGLNVDDQATIFQEITTKGAELSNRHKAFLLWKFLDEGYFRKGDFSQLKQPLKFSKLEKGEKVPTLLYQSYAIALNINAGNSGTLSKLNNVLKGSLAPMTDNKENTVMGLHHLVSFISMHREDEKAFSFLTHIDITVCVVNYFAAIAWAWRRPLNARSKTDPLYGKWTNEDEDPWEFFWAPSHPNYDKKEFKGIEGATSEDEGIITHSSNKGNKHDRTIWLEALMEIFPDVALETLKQKWIDANPKKDTEGCPKSFTDFSKQKIDLSMVTEDDFVSIFERVHVDFKFGSLSVDVAKRGRLQKLLRQAIEISSFIHQEEYFR